MITPSIERAGRIAAVQEVPAGDAATAAGLTFSVRAAREFTAAEDGLDLTDGASLVAAVVDVTPGADSDGAADSCAVTLSEPIDADRRVWSQAYAEDRFGYSRGAGFARECSPATTEPYSMELVFLTPSGVVDDATIDIELRTGPRVETIRLDLPAGS